MNSPLPEILSLNCEGIFCNALSASKCSLRRAQLPEKDLANHYAAEYEPHARRWTDDDRRVVDPERVVVGLFRMLAFTVAADDAFEGSDEAYLYEAARNTLVDALVDGRFGEPLPHD